jgi:hypothetical protein
MRARTQGRPLLQRYFQSADATKRKMFFQAAIRRLGASRNPRSKSFAPQSIYYNAVHSSDLYLEEVNIGIRFANTRTDEVARNGAFQGRLRPEVFLGAPCIKTVEKPSPTRPRFVDTSGVSRRRVGDQQVS